jgi:ribosomal protein S18 acetylase RimI-like enzyme
VRDARLTEDRKAGMLDERDLGHRVVVRHRTPAGPTDVLGQLTRLDGTVVVVRTEDGREHTIDQANVIAGKPIPARPPRYSEIITLERLADRAWPAPHVRHLGDWLLRSAQGWTNRANSALPLGEADRPLAEAVQVTREWYEAQDLPAKITVPLPVRRDVADHLTASGWTARPTVQVQTAQLTDLLAAARPGEVTLHERPSPEFLALVRARKESLPAAAEHVLLAGGTPDAPPVRFAHARDETGTLLAIARGAVVDDYLHLGLVEVSPTARRRGLAQAVSAALAQWAGAWGATRAVLQVEEHNEAAVRLYAKLGFTPHHRYITFDASPSSADLGPFRVS